MSFENPTIKPQGTTPEMPEKKEKSDNLMHKIFEAGAEGGKKFKNTLRALTLAAILSPALGAGVEARAGQIEKQKQEETPIVKMEKVVENRKQEESRKYYVYGRGEMTHKEYQEYQKEQDFLKLEKEKMDLEKTRMIYEYNFLHQLFNNENIQPHLYFIVPRMLLSYQDKQIINNMYQTKRLNATQLLGIVGRYDGNFANKWMMIGNMLKQGIDYNGNRPSEQSLKMARNNYFQVLHYIAGELSR